jgi:hypothetical protein
MLLGKPLTCRGAYLCMYAPGIHDGSELPDYKLAPSATDYRLAPQRARNGAKQGSMGIKLRTKLITIVRRALDYFYNHPA